jgi:ATP dependent DNA ligase domain
VSAVDWDQPFTAIAEAALRVRAVSFTLDGEAVVCGPDGVAVFDALHRRRTASDAVLQAFDLLELNGEDLRQLPLEKRKARLGKLLARADGPRQHAPERREVLVSSRANHTGGRVPSGKCSFSEKLVNGTTHRFGIPSHRRQCGDWTLRMFVMPGSEFLPFSANTGEGIPHLAIINSRPSG